jgi:chromosome segregation ATPase
MTTVSTTEFCNRIERLIALEKATIKRIEQMISFITAELERLNAAPHPDLERIDKLKKQLVEQEERLADAEEGLRQDEEDRFQFCSPDQPEL